MKFHSGRAPRHEAAAPHHSHSPHPNVHRPRLVHRQGVDLAALHGIWASAPEIHQGAPVFAGTAVRLETLLEYRLARVPLYEFLVDFPAVRPLQAKRIWAWMASQSVAEIRTALSAVRKAPLKPDHPEP